MQYTDVLKVTHIENTPIETYSELDILSGKNLSKKDNVKMILDRIIQSNGISATCQNIIENRSSIVYEYEIANFTTKFTKIKGLESIIKMHLHTDSVIIDYSKTINGFSISIAKEDKTIVTLGDVYNSSITGFQCPIGIDIYNNPLIVDITKLPHLMICGSTGSGKSVCMNSIISSLIINNDSCGLKFIMIDPKQVELNPYEPLTDYIPYGIISDINFASTVLYNICQVMDNRYRTISQINCKNIEEYNLQNPTKKFFRIIIFIDELADLMIRNKKEVEPYLCRLAQMGRACGIHLIIATQRPSREVVTGLLKVNIPAKICFKVPSAINSKIVLDQKGAEELSGNGDGLFINGKSTEPIRFQGCYISTEEINAIVNELK